MSRGVCGQIFQFSPAGVTSTFVLSVSLLFQLPGHCQQTEGWSG